MLLYIRIAALVAALGGVAWLVDEIGDRRETKVRRAMAAQVAAANHRADEAEAKWAAQYQIDAAERGKKLEDIIAQAKGGVCAPAPDRVEKLNAIIPRKR